MKDVYGKTVRIVRCATAAVAIASSALAANKTWTDANGAVWTYSGSNRISIRGYASPEGNVVIPDSIDGKPVVAIYSKAFMNCPWIRSVKMPDSVTSIGSQAFSECAWLESVTFPSCEFTIGARAFEDCTRLSELKCEGVIKSVGANAFRGCDSLGEGVIISGGCVLFVNGEYPSEVVLPEGTIGIAGGAFRNCTTLRTVRIPKSLERVGDSAFYECAGLREFIVDPENQHFYSESGMLISKPGKRLVCGVNGDVRIPDGVVEIGDKSFYGLGNLTSVVIPNGVTGIGSYAFAYCAALTHIEIPASVVSVGANAFEGCDGLDNVDVYSLGAFNGDAKHVYTGVVLKDGYSVGIVQIETAKASSRGVRVKGAIMLDDGKKYAIKSAQGQVANGVLKVETSSKLGGMSLVVGLNGFEGGVGEGYTVRSGDTSAAAVLKGTVKKTCVNTAGKFKTARVTLTGFSIRDSESGTAQADGVIQERDKEGNMLFSASIK